MPSDFVYCSAFTNDPDAFRCMNGADWRDAAGRPYCRYHVRREVGRNWRRECERVAAPRINGPDAPEGGGDA